MTDASQVSWRDIKGPPTLIVKVLSPLSRQTDRPAQAKRYAKLGCPHYRIVDPNAQRIEYYPGEGAECALEATAEGNAVLDYSELGGLITDLAEVFRPVFRRQQ